MSKKLDIIVGTILLMLGFSFRDYFENPGLILSSLCVLYLIMKFIFNFYIKNRSKQN